MSEVLTTNGHTKVESRYTFDERSYSILTEDGTEVFYPSVTTILQGVKVASSFLDTWKEEQAAALGVEGARIDMLIRAEQGARVHAAIESYLKGRPLHWLDELGKPQFTDFEWKRLCRFVQWFEQTQPEVLATEFKVFSHVHRYAGTLDAILKIDGEVWVVDWKTSKGIYDTHLLQVAAYWRAVLEMWPGLNPMNAGVLALQVPTKKGWRFEALKGIEELSSAFTRFSHRLTVFYDETGDFQPKRDLLPVELVPSHRTTLLDPGEALS